MKKYLSLGLALGIFVVGFGLGRSSLAPEVDRVHAAVPGPQGVAQGSSGSALVWTQEGDELNLKVVGSEAEYLGAAVLSDPWAWPELGSGEAAILDGGAELSLDLGGVDELTFYRLEPVGSLHGGVFRPCAELPAGCFPPRPPSPDPPWPEMRHVYGRH